MTRHLIQLCHCSRTEYLPIRYIAHNLGSHAVRSDPHSPGTRRNPLSPREHKHNRQEPIFQDLQPPNFDIYWLSQRGHQDARQPYFAMR